MIIKSDRDILRPSLVLKLSGGLATAFLVFNSDAIYQIEYCGHSDKIMSWAAKWQSHAYESGIEITIDSTIFLI